MTFLERMGPLMQALVSVAVITAFFLTIYALLFVTSEITQSVREVLLVLIGVLAGAFKDCIGFYLGSSHGSALKTEALKNSGKP